MKKYKFVLIVIIICISIAILSTSLIGTVYSNGDKFARLFFTWLDNGLMHERALDVGYGCEVGEWGDLPFRITYYESGLKFEYVKDEEKITLLDSVITYNFGVPNKCHVVASNGYAVIEKDENVARIYTSEDKVLLENVYYLTSFEDFEKEEQELFDDLGFYTKSSKQLGIFLIMTYLLIVVLLITLAIFICDANIKK